MVESGSIDAASGREADPTATAHSCDRTDQEQFRTPGGAQPQQGPCGHLTQPARKGTIVEKNSGFTLIELLIVVTVIGILAAIAIPGLLRARMSGNEASAIASMRVINTGEATYASTAASGGYAVQLARLAMPCPGGTAGFISPDLATDPSIKSGYTIALAAGAGTGAGPTDCNGAATRSDYYATAVPLTLGTTGSRSFATSKGGTIWQVLAAAAPTEPFGPPATPVQ